MRSNLVVKDHCVPRLLMRLQLTQLTHTLEAAAEVFLDALLGSSSHCRLWKGGLRIQQLLNTNREERPEQRTESLQQTGTCGVS
jgi:hypothetical protein